MVNFAAFRTQYDLEGQAFEAPGASTVNDWEPAVFNDWEPALKALVDVRPQWYGNKVVLMASVPTVCGGESLEMGNTRRQAVALLCFQR